MKHRRLSVATLWVTPRLRWLGAASGLSGEKGDLAGLVLELRSRCAATLRDGVFQQGNQLPNFLRPHGGEVARLAGVGGEIVELHKRVPAQFSARRLVAKLLHRERPGLLFARERIEPARVAAAGGQREFPGSLSH